MTVPEFIIAIVQIFWLPILLISFGLNLSIKVIWDEIEYRKFMKEKK